MNTGKDQNYFSLLGLPASPEVDAALLEANYRRLQAQWHPDRHVNAAAAQRLEALQRAGQLNEAYATLRSPLGRAGHLLELHGVDTAAQGQAGLDAAFLLRQLELREALEQVLAAGDEPALGRLGEATRAELEAQWRTFAALAEGKDFAAARAVFHKLQFLHKLREEITAAEDRLLD